MEDDIVRIVRCTTWDCKGWRFANSKSWYYSNFVRPQNKKGFSVDKECCPFCRKKETR